MLALTPAPGISSDQQALRWLVTNGSTTVGPVHTELLLRGYMSGRIPEHCQVRDVRWGAWRPLDGIREIGSLKRRLARDTERPLSLRDAAACLPATDEVGELLTWALELAVLTLDANAGLIHRYRSPVPFPVTSSVYGVPVERLGEVLPATDPSYQLALRGKSLCGDPLHGVTELVVAERLQHDAPLRSVAMTPIIASGKLIALLELGRTNHPFRTDDSDDLVEFAAHVARRLG
jgi:GAF domain-containing protein